MPAKNQKYTLFLIVLHLAIALPLAYRLNIWIDEGSTLHTTERGISFAWQHALADEKQAPLYFWILSLWREINHSIFFARLFSVVCSVISIRFFADLARRFFDGKAWFWMTAFFALHPYLLWASLEIRVYALVVLLSILLLKFFVAGFCENENRRTAQIVYGVTAIIALYTNYYLGFLLVGNFAALVVGRRWQSAKSYFRQMLIVGAVFAPLLWQLTAQFAANSGAVHGAKSIGDGLRVLWNIFLTFVLPTEITPPDDFQATAISIVRLWLARLLIVAGIGLFFLRRRKLGDAERLFGAISGVVALFLLAAYFALGVEFVAVRHAAVWFAPLILCVGAWANNTFAAEFEKSPTPRFNFARIAAGALLLLLSTAFIYSIATLYPNLAKRGDWARVGAFIEQREQSDQPIIVFAAYDALTLPYEYHGINQILPDERFFDWDIENKNGAAENWRRQTEFIIAEIPADAREIWLLTDDKCDIKQACDRLENFVQANYTVIEEVNFYRERVRLLRKKTQ